MHLVTATVKCKKCTLLLGASSLGSWPNPDCPPVHTGLSHGLCGRSNQWGTTWPTRGLGHRLSQLVLRAFMS